MLTLREGLLPSTRALSLAACWTLLAGVEGDGKAVSSTSSGIPPFSFSCELDGPMASLLGTGVMLLTTDFRNAGFFTGGVGFVMALAAFEVSLAFKPPLEGVGVGVLLAAFLPKKLWIVRCPDDGGPALEFCFCKDGGARAGVAEPSFAFPIFAGR